MAAELEAAQEQSTEDAKLAEEQKQQLNEVGLSISSCHTYYEDKFWPQLLDDMHIPAESALKAHRRQIRRFTAYLSLNGVLWPPLGSLKGLSM